MNFWIGIFTSLLLIVVATIILSTKIFYPAHRLIAIVLYVVAWIPFFYSLYSRKEFILKHKSRTVLLLTSYWIHAIFAILVIISLYIFLILFPLTKSQFSDLSDTEIKQQLKEDSELILYLSERLDSSALIVEQSILSDVNIVGLSKDDRDNLRETWSEFIQVMFELDIIKEKYRTFYQLSPITQNGVHKQAFLNGYSALVAQRYYATRLYQNINTLSTSEFLNQENPLLGTPKNTLSQIAFSLTSPEEIFKLLSGKAYLYILNPEQSLLINKTRNHLETVSGSLSELSQLIGKRPVDILEEKASVVWFPIQKHIAVNLSYLRAARRDYHITADQIASYRDKFLPGDIFLERREWHATNFGIPGFWTHAALYMGDSEYLDKYFYDLPELKGLMFSEYMEEKFPKASSSFTEKDEEGYSFSVIEVKRPGVIFTSLEETGSADSFAALRVRNMTRSDRFKIVEQALSQYGKPYDFNFSFVSDDTLVCSELIFKSYSEINQLSITPLPFNGRPLFSPNQFAEKFSKETELKNSELDLIVFLDGNEKTGVATEKDLDEFVTTWERPKWYLINDYLERVQ